MVVNGSQTPTRSALPGQREWSVQIDNEVTYNSKTCFSLLFLETNVSNVSILRTDDDFLSRISLDAFGCVLFSLMLMSSFCFRIYQ